MAPGNENTVYVITGANRGIGLGMVTALLARPRTTVVGTVRTEDAAATLHSLSESLQKGENSALHVMQLDFSTAPEHSTIRDRFAAATSNLRRIDVLICCAGQVSFLGPALDTTAADLRSAFEVNTISPLMTFQALWPLMERPSGASLPPPKFILITSSVGSITEMDEPSPGGAYGPSKAAANWLTRALHFQLGPKGLVSVAVHPGWVRTGMGEAFAQAVGPGVIPPKGVEESAAGVLQVVDEAGPERFAGEFVTERGTLLKW